MSASLPTSPPRFVAPTRCRCPPQALRAYLRELAVAAYRQKAGAVDGLEGGLMQEAQKFFVLTQTDNLWKEHLQVGDWQPRKSQRVCLCQCCLWQGL